MASEENTIREKHFLIKIYHNFMEIEKAIRSITQNYADFQLSVLGKIPSNNSYQENGWNNITKGISIQLNKAFDNPIPLGFFKNAEIGRCFIAGYLTSTFLQKVDQKELASLPIGLFGIFRGIGIKLEDINHFLKELQNGNFFLIIRGEKEFLKRIEDL